MGEDDIEILAFAEKNADEKVWELRVTFEGNCLIGCTGRKMLNTKNMVKAMEWADYHSTGPEHIHNLLKRSGGDISKMPAIAGEFKITSSNGEETQP
jgi:hypothetical protein